ncbi:MAG: magnesium and cobalt transport protein CorA [Rikenellaceae bacterium]|nr:magnesium and cobalt transport protein CorA [Rikenellaceae bacterium]MDY4916341.1 CorA family divalent cation transporter [Candidatus Cryptobacteroides sp.]
MVEIFYRLNGQMTVSRSEADLPGINLQDVIWIDLLSPTGDEKRAVEAYLGTVIQSRATAEEIESSSRFSETDAALFANTNFVIPGPESYVMETVSFIIKGTTLTTLREVQLRSFTELQRRLMVFPKMYASGYSVFTSILEQRIDSDADMIEILSKEIEQYNHKVGLEEDINEEFLLDINQLQENTMLLRETIVDKQRVISSILKSPKCPKSIQNKLNVMLKDISSLVNHTNFSFERLEYLQNTVLGIINLDQNKIMKVFTLISLLLMPPTLIASFYGMNVALPIIPCDSPWNWVIIITMMIISVLIVFLLLKRKKLL